MEREAADDEHDENDESDESDDMQEEEAKEEEEVKKFEIMVEKGEAGTFHKEDVQTELLSMANPNEDEIFSKFRSTIDKYPNQILRCRFFHYIIKETRQERKKRFMRLQV